MTDSCVECGQEIQPITGGYPEGTKNPWHYNPNGSPCHASQAPYRASSAFPEGSATETAWKAQKAVGLAPVLTPGRAWLKGRNPDENIRLWLDLVEKQTGKPFQLAGDAYCTAEELGEAIEAEFRSDKAQVEDGLCDTYVTAVVAEVLLRREHPSIKPGRIQVAWDHQSNILICAAFSGRLASYVRKPVRSLERAHAVLDSLVTAKAAIRREVKGLGLDWETSIGKVLDILDKRLGQGYAMNSAGSAIKASDQK